MMTGNLVGETWELGGHPPSTSPSSPEFLQPHSFALLLHGFTEQSCSAGAGSQTWAIRVV